MQDVIVEISADGQRVTVGGNVVRKAVPPALLNVIVNDLRPSSPVHVDLWMEGDEPQVSLHTTGQDFDTVKEKLIQLRDRLTQEIENGPSMCPFSTEKKTNTGSASQLASCLSSRQILANTAKEAGFIFPDTYSEQAIQLLLDGDAEAIRAAAEQVHEWQDLRDNGPVICEWDDGSQQLRKRPYAATPKEQEVTQCPEKQARS